MTEYILYRARIESDTLAMNSTKHLCRILPEMEEIAETNLLPEYPPFFYNGHEAYHQGDVVWCLTTSDFQLGYILGMCESPVGRDITSFITEINEAETYFGLISSVFTDLSLTIVNNCFIDFANNKTGTNGRVSSAGSVVIYGSDGSVNIKAINSSIVQDSQGDVQIDGKNVTVTSEDTIDLETRSLNENVTKKQVKIFQSSTESIGGDETVTVLGSSQKAYTKDASETYLAKKEETIGQGEKKTIVAGGSKINVVVGDYEVTTALGNVRIISALGGVLIKAGLGGMQIISDSTLTIKAPLLSMVGPTVWTTPTGVTVPNGMGPFCALPVCLLTGAPHSGNVFTGV